MPKLKNHKPLIHIVTSFIEHGWWIAIRKRRGYPSKWHTQKRTSMVRINAENFDDAMQYAIKYFGLE